MIGGPNLWYVRVEPPLAGCTSTTAVDVTLFTLSVLFGCSCSEWPPGLRYFIIYSIFLSSPPPDRPSSGTESNVPVSHPTPGVQIVDYDTSDHGLYVEKLERKGVCPPKKKRDDQSAISSNKELVKYKATQSYLSVTYQHTTSRNWPANSHSNEIRDHSNIKHVILLSTYHHLRVAPLINGGATCIIIQPSRPRGRSHSQCCCVASPGAVIAITTYCLLV